MKKLLFSVCILSFLNLNAQNYTQDFESGSLPPDWNVQVSGPGEWTFNTNSVPGGSVTANQMTPFSSNAAIFDDDANYGSPINSIGTLFSPVFDLSEATTASISFEYACNFYPIDDGGTFKVYVYNGSTWEVILTKTTMTQPTVVSFDVSSYTNANFQVKFVFDDGTKWSWGAGVDNFSLTTDELGISNLSTTNFSIYPNPANDQFTVNSDKKISSVTLFDLSGKKLNTYKNTSSINISDQKPGVYLVEIYFENGEKKISKLLKK